MSRQTGRSTSVGLQQATLIARMPKQNIAQVPVAVSMQEAFAYAGTPE